MKKSYRLEDLDCANCARKMEDAVAKIPGVIRVSIGFMTQKMTIEAEDTSFEQVVKEAEKCIRRVDPDCRIVK